MYSIVIKIICLQICYVQSFIQTCKSQKKIFWFMYHLVIKTFTFQYSWIFDQKLFSIVEFQITYDAQIKSKRYLCFKSWYEKF